MKTTNNIFNVLTGSPGWKALVEGDKKMSVPLIIGVQKAMQALSDASKLFDDTRLQILTKYVKTNGKDQNGNPNIVRTEEGGIEWKADNSEALWNTAFKELCDVEIEIKFDPIKITDKDIYGRLGPRDLIVLEEAGVIKIKK